MRALTLWQPHASLVMTRTPEGGCLKPVENRTRPVPSTLPQWHRCPCGHRISPDEEHPYGDPRGHAIVRPDPWTGEPMRDACGPGEPDGPLPFRLGIHAGKGWDQDGWGYAWDLLGFDTLMEQIYPPGCLLGTVLVTGCHHADDHPDDDADFPYLVDADQGWQCSEWAQPDCYHIEVTDPRPLPEPIPMRGYQGWWPLPDDVAGVLAGA